jgi:hypothetical protein
MRVIQKPRKGWHLTLSTNIRLGQEGLAGKKGSLFLQAFLACRAVKK